jgi:hypothetical protein
MWHDFEGLVDEVLFDLGADTDRAGPGTLRARGLTEAQGNLVAAHHALDQAVARRNVRANLNYARTFLRQAVANQRSLEASAFRAMRAIQQGNLNSALSIVRAMYRKVGGGSA